MSRLTVESVERTDTTIRCSIDATGELRRYFTGDPFFAEYSVDISDVPESILPVPLLGSACSVAWAAGADVHVPTLDRDFYRSLQELEAAYREMYPGFMQGGDIHVDELVDNRREGVDGTGLLFSGGLDSVTSYLRHREESPSLITIHGGDIFLRQREAWERTKSDVEAFGEKHGAENLFVRSNMREFLDRTMLLAHFSRYFGELWYSSVQMGPAMLTLCAPLADVRDIGTLYIAASLWEGRRHEQRGSHPDVDELVSWSNTEVVHDAFELSRQDKIEVVADYVRSAGDDLFIRACFESEAGGNCNRCEKCARTIAGLVAAGLDPNDHGFDADRNTFEYIRTQLEDGGWILEESHEPQWAVIRRQGDPDEVASVPGAREFFEWLATADVESFIERSSSPRYHAVLHALVRNTPYPVYERLYPTYEKYVKERG